MPSVFLSDCFCSSSYFNFFLAFHGMEMAFKGTMLANCTAMKKGDLIGHVVCFSFCKEMLTFCVINYLLFCYFDFM